jgi:hypothetical protein
MKVEALRWMVKKWQDDQNAAVGVMSEDSKTAKGIRDSPLNLTYEYDANHAKKVFDRYCQDLPKEERQLLYGLGRRSRNWFDDVLHQPITRDKKMQSPGPRTRNQNRRNVISTFLSGNLHGLEDGVSGHGP